MDIWTGPLIIVIVIICSISIAAVRKSSREVPVVEGRAETKEVIEEHPFTLNPILWIILVAAAFMGIVIVYYATSFY